MNTEMMTYADRIDFNHLKSYVGKMNVHFDVSNHGLHWQFRFGSKVMLDAWPSTRKFRVWDGPTQTASHGYFAKMLVALKGTVAKHEAAKRTVSTVPVAASAAVQLRKQRRDLYPQVVLALLSGGYELGEPTGAEDITYLINDAAALTAAIVKHMDDTAQEEAQAQTKAPYADDDDADDAEEDRE